MSKVFVGVNSKCGVQSKRKCKSHESCVCIARFPACGCQKKSVVYETECRHVSVLAGKPGPEPFIALKHIPKWVTWLIGQGPGAALG